MPNEKNLNRLNKLLEAFDSGAVQPDELIKAIDAVMAILDQNSKTLADTIHDNKLASEGDFKRLKADLGTAQENLKALVSQVKTNSDTSVADVRKAILKEIARVESLIPVLPPETDLTEVFENFEGHRAEMARLAELVLGENIRNALESLQGDDRLDKSAIRGLDELVEELKSDKKVVGAAGVRLLKYLADVNIEGITDGQTLVWNAATSKFIPGSASGGIPDGDKGDITVSNSGATWTIDNNTIGQDELATTGTPDGSKFLRDDMQWTAIPGGGDALTANPLSQFAATTSAQLRGVLSDEVGTGAAVFASTKAEFDSAVTDGNFLYVGDVTQYTDELAQDAVGAMVSTSIVYNDAGATLQRAALTGAITAPQDSNTTSLGSFTTAELNTALSDNNVATGGGTATGTNTGDQTSIVGITGTKAQFDTAVTDGNFMYIGDAPTSHTHLLAAGATDVTASAAEVNILDGATLSTTELNYVDGVTSAIQTQLNDRELLTNKATDFSTVNDTKYPTVEAVAEYVASAVVGLLDYRGTYDASTNLYPATGGSGLAGAVLKGDFYIVSVAGTLGGTAVTAGDLVIALVDTPAQTSSNWDIISNEVGYIPENAANKVTSISGASTDTQYPSAKLVYDQLALKAALASPTFTGTVTTPAIVVSSETASTLASFDASKNVKSLATASYPSLTEIAYVKGVTSAIQTQLNAKEPTLAAASDTVAGKVELATAAETTTGTDATRAVTPDALAGSNFGKRVVGVQVSGSASGDTALATGDGLASFDIPAELNGMNLVGVMAGVTTVSSSGAPLFQVRRSRRSSATARTIVDMLSTGVSVDASEFESADATTAPVINTSNDDVQTGDAILIDCDTAGTGTKGAKVTLIFQLP